MKTFVLYARLPRTFFKEISIAEKESEEGLNKYNELMALFRNEYASKPLASDDGM
jgi:hypothetical protein